MELGASKIYGIDRTCLLENHNHGNIMGIIGEELGN
jgi:hypothetical protein